MKRATEALVHEAQSRTRDAHGSFDGDDVDAVVATPVSASASKMVSGMAQVSLLSSLHMCLWISQHVCLLLSYCIAHLLILTGVCVFENLFRSGHSSNGNGKHFCSVLSDHRTSLLLAYLHLRNTLTYLLTY